MSHGVFRMIFPFSVLTANGELLESLQQLFLTMFLKRHQNDTSFTACGERALVASWLPGTPEISGFVMDYSRPGRALEVGTSHSRIE